MHKMSSFSLTCLLLVSVVSAADDYIPTNSNHVSIFISKNSESSRIRNNAFAASRHLTQYNRAQIGYGRNITKTTRFQVGVNFSNSNSKNEGASSFNVTTAGIFLDSRKYFSLTKRRTFIEAGVFYAQQNMSRYTNSELKNNGYGASFNIGMEYFISNQISIDGKLGFDYEIYNYNGNDVTNRLSIVNFLTNAIGINVYW